MGMLSPKEETLFKFYKIGMDPEFAFYDRKQGVVVSATNFCGGRSALHAKIGTDGHSETAELRTTPTRNVLMALVDLALSLREIDKVIGEVNAGGYTDIIAIAQPYFAGESLGGHIHLSYWAPTNFTGVHEKIYNLVNRTTGGFCDRYSQSFPGRNVNAFSYREQPTVSPTQKAKEGHSFYRTEYRRPGSWLANPTLAYSFLGLAKLAFIGDPDALYQFEDALRIDTKHPVAKAEPDLKYLGEALKRSNEFVDKLNVNSFRGPIGINFPAWRGVLEA